MSAQTTLDEEWLHQEGDQKTFFGGLIQLAVSLYHLTNENPKGAKKVYENARGMLAPLGENRDGIDLQKLLSEMDRLYSEQINVDEWSPDYFKLCPKIEFQE